MKKIVGFSLILVGVHSYKSPPYSECNIYKITKIDSIDNVYVIYALKSDTIYKVLSLRTSLYKCSLVSVGASDPLKLKSLFI